MSYEHDPLQLGPDVYASASALDIDDRWQTPAGTRSGVPLAMQLLQMVGTEYREGAVDAQMMREFGALQERIADALHQPGVGFLLEVAIYRDALGHLHIPSGQLLYPVGVGIHPIDALAEHLRVPGLRPMVTREPGLENRTFHLWIMKGGPAGMTGWTVPAEFRERLITQASREARRRHLLAAWSRVWPDERVRTIARAAYWTEVYEQRAHLIRDSERRAEIDRLNQRMMDLEARANKLYGEFQAAARVIARAQAYAATLERIAAITDLIEKGMKLGELVSRSSGDPVVGAGEAPDADVLATREQTAGVVRLHERVRVETSTGMRYELERMREYESRLDKLYDDDGVPLPARSKLRLEDLETDGLP